MRSINWAYVSRRAVLDVLRWPPRLLLWFCIYGLGVTHAVMAERNIDTLPDQYYENVSQMLRWPAVVCLACVLMHWFLAERWDW